MNVTPKDSITAPFPELRSPYSPPGVTSTFSLGDHSLLERDGPPMAR